MSAFDTSYATSAFPALLAVHGETVAYYPRAAEPREIKAIVTRLPPQSVPGTVRARSPVWRLVVRNDEDAGIAADSLDTGGDEIRLTERIGGTDSRRQISRLVDHNAAVVVVETR